MKTITPIQDDVVLSSQFIESTLKPSLTYDEIIQKLTTSWGSFSKHLKWIQSEVTFSIGQGATNAVAGTESSGLISMSVTQKSAALLAFKLWNDLISDIKLTESQSSSSDITLNYSSATGNGTYSKFGNLYVTSDSNSYRISADRIWLASQWTANGDSGLSNGGYGLITMIHEIGHSLGLSHPGIYNAGSGGSITFDANAEFQQDNRSLTVMSYFGGYAIGSGWTQDGTYLDYLYPQTPMVGDILAIQYLYGANLTTRTTDTIYGYNCNISSSDPVKSIFDFSLNTHPIFTIYDAGGNDLLDCSNYSNSQTIDLTPGQYSSVLGMVRNVAIAFNTSIECAISGAGNDVLIGNSSNNTLNGGDGNDILTGGAGNDILIGGAGTADYACYAYSHTNYSVSYINSVITVTSSSEGVDTLSGIEYLRCFDGDYSIESLIDPVDNTAPTVNTFVPASGSKGASEDSNIVFIFSESITKGSGLIRLRKMTAVGDVVETFDVANSLLISINESTLTINPSSNLESGTKYYVTFDSGAILDLFGNNFVDSATYNFTTGYTGTNGNDILTGTSNVDYLNGLSGNDVLTGGGAIDFMDGGDGSDVYVVTMSTDHAAAEVTDTGSIGIDEVRFSSSVAGSTLTLYQGDTGIETAVIGTGTASVAVSTATTALNINASAVANAMRITGNAGSNSLLGTAYADTLIGGAGLDKMDGGGGADLYVIALAGDHTAAEITDTGSFGTDEVLFTSTIANSKLTLYKADTGLEKITLGTGGISNIDTSGITALSINASAVLNGLTLVGNAGINTLTGTAFNDTIDGGGGADKLIGGKGNDTYIVDSTNDVVTESTNAGTDAISTFVNYTLPNNVENLTLIGQAAINATGNSLANVISGNDANNIINGGKAADSLWGGLGCDSFVFTTGSSGQTATTLDKIMDYSRGMVGVGDLIDYVSNLTVGGSASAATTTEASINTATGVATFAAGSGTTLSDAISDIATRMTTVINTKGEFALFEIINSGDYYVFISDGAAGVGSNDVLIQLVGVNSINGIDITGGNLTLN